MSEEAWELFDLITSAYWGKQMYFAQTDGIIYSRKSGRYMSADDAVSEFVSLLSWKGEEDGKQTQTAYLQNRAV